MRFAFQRTGRIATVGGAVMLMLIIAFPRQAVAVLLTALGILLLGGSVVTALAIVIGPERRNLAWEYVRHPGPKLPRPLGGGDQIFANLMREGQDTTITWIDGTVRCPHLLSVHAHPVTLAKLETFIEVPQAARALAEAQAAAMPADGRSAQVVIITDSLVPVGRFYVEASMRRLMLDDVTDDGLLVVATAEYTAPTKLMPRRPESDPAEPNEIPEVSPTGPVEVVVSEPIPLGGSGQLAPGPETVTVYDTLEGFVASDGRPMPNGQLTVNGITFRLIPVHSVQSPES